MVGRGGIGVKRAKPIAKAIKLFRKSGRMVNIRVKKWALKVEQSAQVCISLNPSRPSSY